MKNEKTRNFLAQVNKWMFKHEIISSFILTFLLGLVVGGVSVALDWWLV